MRPARWRETPRPRSLRGGGEDGLLVGLQDAQPAIEILSVIRTRRVGDPQIGAQESGTELGNQFLHGVGAIAEALAELAIAAGFSARPVNELMQLGRGVSFGWGAGRRADKRLAQVQLNAVGGGAVIGAVAAVVHDCPGLGDEGFGRLDRREDGRDIFNHGRLVAVDLLGGENGRGAGEETGFGLVAVVGSDTDLLVEDDVSGFLAFADLRAGLGLLLVGTPGAGRITQLISGGPEGEDAAIGILRGDIDGAHDVAGRAVPGEPEFAGAGLDRGNDLVGDVLVNVEAFGLNGGAPLFGGPRECGLVGAGGPGPIAGGSNAAPLGAPRSGAELHKQSAEASRVDHTLAL
jgi:hypothetical protein